MPDTDPPDLDALERTIARLLERDVACIEPTTEEMAWLIARARRAAEAEVQLEQEGWRRAAAWVGPCVHGRSPITRCDDGCDEMVGHILEGWTPRANPAIEALAAKDARIAELTAALGEACDALDSAVEHASDSMDLEEVGEETDRVTRLRAVLAKGGDRG